MTVKPVALNRLTRRFALPARAVWEGEAPSEPAPSLRLTRRFALPSLKRVPLFLLPVLLAVVVGVSLAQPGRRGRGRGRFNPPGVIPADRGGVPPWKIDERFKNDVFTFVRIEYDDGYRGGRGRWGGWGGYGWGGRWATDYPDSDWNFSFRLQQLTSLKVNPEPITMRLTDERLLDYPFIYIIEPGLLVFREEEVTALRHYLLNGGFLMVDDFWGDEEWENFHREIKRVFPEPGYDPVELNLDHEIFRCVYRLKEKPQVPGIQSWVPGGPTWETRHFGNTREVHFKGISDKKNRLMVLICHNTDLGDGWEREGEDPDYFKEFSEKKSYPMGINIVTYAMTH